MSIHEERAHAINGPSSLSRRLACLGSRVAEEGLEDTPSAKAAEGTKAHELFERILTDPENWAPEGCERDMITYVMDAARWVDEKVSHGYTLYVETKVDPEQILGPETWGTADIILVKDEHIIVADLKYGHHEVHAIGNVQLMAYAAGAVLTLYPANLPEVNFTLVILQPRLPMGPTVKSTDTSLVEIQVEWERIRAALASPVKTRTPSGDACTFCLAKLTCEARGSSLAAVSADMFNAAGVGIVDNNPLSITTPADIGLVARPTASLTSILDEEAFIQGVFDDVREEVTHRIRAGEEVSGYKIVEGPGRRSWVLTEEELRKKFKGMAIPKAEYEVVKIGSPKHVESLERLKEKQKENLKQFYKHTSGKEKLVISTASGNEVVYSSARAFDKALDPAPTVEATVPEPYNFL